MKCDKKSLLLYAVTDRAWLGENTPGHQVEESILGGATMIQLREKHLDRRAFLAEAREIKALCGRYGVPFLINDNVDIAVEIGADGVHVGQHDMEAGAVRQKIGPDRILGVSAQTVEQARALRRPEPIIWAWARSFPPAPRTNATAVGLPRLRTSARPSISRW